MVTLIMCKCNDVKIVDVLYHTSKGNKIILYHKNCGEDLSDEQNMNIDNIQRQKWDISG